MGTFKLHKAIDLADAEVNMVSSFGLSNCIAITATGGAEIFRCNRQDDVGAWYYGIEGVIKAIKDKRAAQELASIPKGLPSRANMGARASLIHRFLVSEMSLAETIRVVGKSVISPLIDASKGAILTVQTEKTGYQGKKGMFDDGQNSATRVQAQAITEALQAADMQIFLRAAEALVAQLKEFSEAFRVRATQSEWAETTAVSDLFTNPKARGLYNQYKAYVNGQQGALRILRGPLFVLFYREAEEAVSKYPGNFSEKLEAPRSRPNQYKQFIDALLQNTPADHPDYAGLQSAQQAVAVISDEVDSVVKGKKNFEKLLEIQASLVVSNSMFGMDDTNKHVVARLANTERKFIKEGDLKKVCRKKNKTFRFWLFSDYFIYGSALGNGSFSFHRALDLKTCSVALHSGATLKNAFEIFGAEKSFIVIATTPNTQNDWVNKIKEARLKMGIKDEDNVSTAPIWVSDSGSDVCFICSSSFGVFRRRHHCRKCGNLVCGDHSKKSEVIPHIHKTEKHRVCDKCFGSGPNPPPSVKAPASHAAGAPASPTGAQKPSSGPPGRPTGGPPSRPTGGPPPRPGGSAPTRPAGGPPPPPGAGGPPPPPGPPSFEIQAPPPPPGMSGPPAFEVQAPPPPPAGGGGGGPPRPAFLSAIAGGDGAATLSAPKPASPMGGGGGGGGLLGQIQAGRSLKKVSDAPAPAPAPAQESAGGMLSALAAAMGDRRQFVKDESDDDSDSDNGFSDSDSD
jgi:hypothetical protein